LRKPAISLVRSINPPWRCHTNNSHDAACVAAEKWIEINSEEDLTTLFSHGAFAFDKRKPSRAKNTGGGLRVTCAVPRLNAASEPLLAGDRLHPQPNLPTTSKYTEITAPLRLRFWRTSAETLMKFRNPLWSGGFGLSLVETFSIDYLHTVGLGVMGFIVLECFWRAVASQRIGGLGDAHAREAQACL